MKTLSVALACTVLAVSISSAIAHLSTGDRPLAAELQWTTVVPIRPNAHGEPSCPSNFVIRGRVCVNIFADSRAHYFSAGDRQMVRPWINRRGEVQCPGNYVLRRKVCISLYY